MPIPIHIDASGVDLSSRFFFTNAITGSPALAAETVVATLTPTGDIAVTKGVFLFGGVAFTVGTSGTAVTYRIRQTALAGAVVFTSGAVTSGITAAGLVNESVQGVDTAPVMPGQVYVLTLQVTAGAAASTVSAVSFAGFYV